MNLLRIVVGLISVAIAGAPAHGQAPDPRAGDAVQLFGAFCVSTGGARERAVAVLGEGNALATRLPDDIVQQAQGGREGGIGWMVRSPQSAEIILDYDRRGICAVRIREADEASVRDAFAGLVRGVARGVSQSNAGELSSQPPQVGDVDGIRTTYTAHSFPLGDRKAHLALTTAAEPIGTQQHFMTFSFID